MAENKAALDDPRSPTSQIHTRLREKGYQPTADNVRRMLQADSRDQSELPDLVADDPPPDDANGLGGSKGEGKSSNKSAVSATKQGSGAKGGNATGSGTEDAFNQPNAVEPDIIAGGGVDELDLTPYILGAAALPAALYAMSKFAGGGAPTVGADVPFADPTMPTVLNSTMPSGAAYTPENEPIDLYGGSSPVERLPNSSASPPTTAAAPVPEAPVAPPAADVPAVPPVASAAGEARPPGMNTMVVRPPNALQPQGGANDLVNILRGISRR